MKFWKLTLVLFALFATMASAEDGDGYETSDSKLEWPECEGMKGEEAEAFIKQQNEGLTVVVVPQHAMVTMDYRMDRVRIRVDDNGMVVETPRIG